MSMGNLIYEGVKRIDNLNRIRKELPEVNTVLKLSTDPISLFQDVVLSTFDKKILFMIDGKKTVKELIDTSSMNSFQAMKTLYTLYSAGIVEEKKDEAETEEAVSIEQILKNFNEKEEELKTRTDMIYTDIEKLSPSDLLEIDESSNTEMIKNNYYKLVKEFHPDRYLAVNDPLIKDKVISILEAITKAYSLLKEDEKRSIYFHKQKMIAKMNSFLDALKKRRDEFFDNLEESELANS
jgi:hypothetical protein